MSAVEKYEEAARGWEAGGRPASLLLAGQALVALRLWAHGRSGLSGTLHAYQRAAEKAQPAGWLDDALERNTDCALCKGHFRLESLLLCTHLPHAFCHDCVWATRRGPDGALACACGGELVG